ncbi:hypothetical protein COAQ111491_19605 [Comamonas aquatilis]
MPSLRGGPCLTSLIGGMLDQALCPLRCPFDGAYLFLGFGLGVI